MIDDGKVWVSELVNACTVFAKFKKMTCKETDMDRQVKTHTSTQTHLAILPILPGGSRSCKTVRYYRMSQLMCWSISSSALCCTIDYSKSPPGPWHHQLQTASTGSFPCTVWLYIKDELKCLFPERELPCCDVFAIQTITQPMHGLKGQDISWRKSDWSAVGKCCCHSSATIARALFVDS